MIAAPIPDNENDRLKALSEAGIFDAHSSPGLDRVTALAARLLGAPMAAVSLVDRDRLWFKSTVGLADRGCRREGSFCERAILGPEPLVVPDALRDERFVDHPLVAGEPHVRFYAGAPLRTPRGLALGTLCVMDVRPRRLTPDELATLTALGEQAGELIELGARVRRAERASGVARPTTKGRSSFITGVNHELRTPLTPILGYAELLAEGGTENDVREASEVIRRNAGRLLSLIDELVDHGELETGALLVRPGQVSLAASVRDAEGAVHDAAVLKGLVLDARMNPGCPDVITTDGARLRQILVNLLSASIRFTDRGGVRLLARFEPEGGSNKLVVEIEDTGPGISPDLATRPFEPFACAGGAAAEQPPGTGLGLAISRKLARQMGGDITLGAIQGGGNRFTLRIDAGSGVAQGIMPLAGGGPELELSGLRILLAEDSPDSQRLLSHHLRRAGAMVVVAPNGAAAVEAVVGAASAFDVVLMDIQMPVLDGHGATRQLRLRGYDGRIVALTANATAEERDKCLAGGFDAYDTKPITRERLIAVCVEMGRAGVVRARAA